MSYLNTLAAAVLCLSLIFSVGCSSKPYKAYDGKRLPDTEVATVYGFNEYADASNDINGLLRIEEINGHKIRNSYSVQVKPGMHQFKVLYVYEEPYFNFYTYYTYTLELEAGDSCALLGYTDKKTGDVGFDYRIKKAMPELAPTGI